MPESSKIRGACELCRARKYKCDKKTPCSNCFRHTVQCVYNPRPSKPRGRAGGRKPRATRPQDRLSRLESILGNIQVTVQSQLSLTNRSDLRLSSLTDPDTNSQAGAGSSELSIHSTSSFWSSLTSEVTRLLDAFPVDSDRIRENELEWETAPDTASRPDPSDTDQTVDSSNEFNILPLVFKTSTVDDKGQHPSPSIRSALFNLFLQRVDPVFKIIHAPSVWKQLMDLNTGPISTSKHADSSLMLFAVYSAAVMSMNEDESRNLLNIGRMSALRRFCLATETCLMHVDYLNTQNMNTLQAFTIYLLVIRSVDNGQRHWALIALGVRLARGMGLHRRAIGHRKSFFEQEMRARLWHQLRILDFRAALDRGEEPELDESSYDTPGCLNIHDEDIVPDMYNSPQPRMEITACTFNVLSHDCVTICKSLNKFENSHIASGMHDEWRMKQQEVKGFIKMLETNIIPRCVDQNPLERYIKTVWQGLIPMCQLMFFRPIWQYSHLRPQPVAQGDILRLALASLRAENAALSDPALQPFVWYTWIQWYTLAVALAELCGQPTSEQSQEAWVIVKKAYSHQSKYVADSTSGKLWQPIKRLMIRAQSLRDTQNLHSDQAFLDHQPPGGQQRDPRQQGAHLSPTPRQNLIKDDDEMYGRTGNRIDGKNSEDIAFDDEAWYLQRDTITSDSMDAAWSFWQDFTRDLSELS